MKMKAENLASRRVINGEGPTDGQQVNASSHKLLFAVLPMDAAAPVTEHEDAVESNLGPGVIVMAMSAGRPVGRAQKGETQRQRGVALFMAKGYRVIFNPVHHRFGLLCMAGLLLKIHTKIV
jgi:hypothetical protein